MRKRRLIVSIILIGLLFSCSDLFFHNAFGKLQAENLLDVRFQGFEKEKAVLLQVMRPFSSISLTYTSEWSLDEKTWNRRFTKDEFHWDRNNGNYRHNKIHQYKNNAGKIVVQVGEITGWNKKIVGFGYTCIDNLDTFRYPDLGKIPLDKNSLVTIEKSEKLPFFPRYHFPNLQYILNGFDMRLIDILNDPERTVKIKKEKDMFLKITIAYDKALPDREDFILEFDLERGVLVRSILNFHLENNRDLEKSHVIELDQFVDIKGWKIPMYAIHSKRDGKGKTKESIRFMIDRESFKLNEPISSQTFMARIAQPVTIYDETLGITYKSSIIPDSTSDAIAAELDGLLEDALKPSKIK